MNLTRIAFGTVLVMLSTACMSQNEDPAQSYVYSTYHVCDLATQDKMDTIIAKFDKPVLDAAVESGEMTGWGYYSHMTGGPWRKLQFHVAPTIAKLLENQVRVFAKIYENNQTASDSRAEACAEHVDYIWGYLDGSSPDTEAERSPKAALAAYYVCDYAREEQADEIVTKIFAPVLNELVEDGKLAGWGWLAHRVGGEYRRLHTMTGESHAAILEAREQLLSATGGQAGGGFGEICHSHTDYLWDVVH